MKPEVYQRVTELCAKIQTEADNDKFFQLIQELNHLLEEADTLQKLPPKKSPSPTVA